MSLLFLLPVFLLPSPSSLPRYRSLWPTPCCLPQDREWVSYVCSVEASGRKMISRKLVDWAGSGISNPFAEPIPFLLNLQETRKKAKTRRFYLRFKILQGDHGVRGATHTKGGWELPHSNSNVGSWILKSEKLQHGIEVIPQATLSEILHAEAT